LKSEVFPLKNVRLGDVLDIRDGTHDTPKYVEIGIPLITSKNLTDSGLCFRDISFISEADHKQISNRSAVENGDILYGMIGTIGKPTLVDTDREFSIKNVALFKKSNANINNKYLRWLLDSPAINKQIAHASKGGTQKFVSLGALRELKATLPSYPEQLRIAAILDQADALRAKRREALAQLDSLTQSIFIEMFGDRQTIFTRWPVKNLGDLLEFLTSGSRGWAEYYTDSGALFLRIQNIGRDELNLNDVAYVNAPDSAESKRTQVREGDVLLSITADLGRTAVIPAGIGKAHINQHLSILRTQAVAPKFLSAFLSSPWGQLEIFGRNKHGVKAGLNFDDIRSFRIPLPPQELQLEFVQRAEVVAEQKSLQHKSLIELDSLFTSLQHRAFRGEL
jgi:type I restriction enzyme S subunit